MMDFLLQVTGILYLNDEENGLLYRMRWAGIHNGHTS